VAVNDRYVKLRIPAKYNPKSTQCITILRKLDLRALVETAIAMEHIKLSDLYLLRIECNNTKGMQIECIIYDVVEQTKKMFPLLSREQIVRIMYIKFCQRLENCYGC
jgi:hypothetical protein